MSASVRGLSRRQHNLGVTFVQGNAADEEAYRRASMYYYPFKSDANLAEPTPPTAINTHGLRSSNLSAKRTVMMASSDNYLSSALLA